MIAYYIGKEIRIMVSKDIPIEKISLKRRLIKEKTRYYDIVIHPYKADGWYVFSLDEFVTKSVGGKEYAVDISVGDAEIEKTEFPYTKEIDINDATFLIEPFKNGKGFSYTVNHKVVAYLDSINIQGNMFCGKIVANKDIANPQIGLYKRATKSRELVYDKKIKLSVQGGQEINFRFNTALLLRNYCQTQKEIWDVVLILEDGNYVPIVAGDIVFDYVENDGIIEYKFFNSEGFLSIWTKYNDAINAHRKKIAILGSCYIKEAFHSLDFTNPDYKLFYDNVITGFHHSLISLCSKKTNNFYCVAGEHAREIELYSRFETEKLFFTELEKAKVDYLLIDNYADATLFLIKNLEDGCFYTKNYYLGNSNLFKQMPNILEYSQHEQIRLEEYKKAVKVFRGIIQKFIPLTHVCLVRSRQSLYKESGGGRELWKDHEFYEKSNLVWELLDDIFLEAIPEARQIDMRSTQWISVENTPLKCTPNHFQSEYYRALLNDFNKIVLYDMLNSK